MMKLFSRPYPSSTAGVLHYFRFDWDKNIFSMTYSPVANGTTIIKLNKDWGKWKVEIVDGVSEGVDIKEIDGGVTIVVKEGWKCKSTTSTGRLSIEAKLWHSNM